MTVGFIGLGTMGRPVALHMVQRGHQMGVWARRPETLEPLVAQGAAASSSPAELAARSDVLFTMVTATADVESVLFGPDGVAQGGRPGLLVVDMSTIAPLAARDFAGRLAAKGIDMLDAPVSGGPEGAQKGALTIMVGGQAAAFERAKPLFECFGANIFHLGASGSGQVTKACQQLLLLINAEGAAEALTLASRGGVDPGLAQKALMTSIASSRVLDRFGSRMATRQFENGISTRLYRKDLSVVLDYARTLGVDLPAGSVVSEHISRLMEQGLGNADLSSLITVLEEKANV